MPGLILGVDVCDDYTQISLFDMESFDAQAVGFGEDEKVLIPTMVCKKKGEDTWLIGEEAYRVALFGEGSMVDKLVKLVSREGTATIEGVMYTAKEMFQTYLEQILDIPRKRTGEREIVSVAYTIREVRPGIMDLLVEISENLGIPRERVHILNHTEAFLFYVLSQKQDIWSNQVCAFDLVDHGLHYYELGVMRGRRPQVVEAIHEELEEGFSLELLETPSGERLADRILSACARRVMDKKVISSVFLTGKGFENPQWPEDFLRFVCNKRRVFGGQNLFSKGACFVAFDSLQKNSSYPYICICEGRLRSQVAMNVQYEGRQRQLIIAAAGSNWYETKAAVTFVLDGTDQVDFMVTPVGSPSSNRYTVDLAEFPRRPAKTTKVEVIVSFTGERGMTVRVFDKGFGELFPSSGKMVRRDFYI
ncbi:MAG: hypothetical protein HFI38_11085 [Lachnospiraceae bacterium]|jgi:hypothetical protein|nr:hypothetical protein [Lachnospiraceae bacterium]